VEIVIFKKDNLRLGLVLGLVAPIISLVIYYFVKFYPTFTIKDFFNFMRTNKSQITAISVPCLMLNIVLFTIYINSHRDNTAKGVFAATLIYAILALLFKFI
jgi:formate-dependent nitrite reductase membrane component NrfD